MIKNIIISLCIIAASLFAANISYSEKPGGKEVAPHDKGGDVRGGGQGNIKVQRSVEPREERPARQSPQFSPREVERSRSFERQDYIDRKQPKQDGRIKAQELKNKGQTEQRRIEQNLKVKQAEENLQAKEEAQRRANRQHADQQRAEIERQKAEQERAREKAKESIEDRKKTEGQQAGTENRKAEQELRDEKAKQDKLKQEQQEKQNLEKQKLEKQNLGKPDLEKRDGEKQNVAPKAIRENVDKTSVSLPTTTSTAPKASSIARDARNNPAAPTTKLAVSKIEQKGNKKSVQVNLNTIIGNKPIILDHQRRAPFFFIFNRTFTDVIFVYPIALGIPGFYEFEWSPLYDDDYFLWADIAPTGVNVEEYSTIELAPATTKTKVVVNKTVIMQTTVQGYTFKLSFDKENLIAGVPVVGTLTVSDERGNPINNLEPVMGSFIHIAAFYVDDLKTVVYAYSLGSPPTDQYSRAGPELKFYIDPEQTGFMKIFIQVKIKGELIVVPFGVNIG